MALRGPAQPLIFAAWIHPGCGSREISNVSTPWLRMVIWVTGLSGSGKSTLCEALRPKLKALRANLVMLDGDVIRAAFGSDLDFHEADRVKQIRRIQAIAKVLADQDITVLVAALYSHPELLEWNRKNLRGYFEVYVNADVQFLLKRDGKKLYSRARSGEMTNVVGIDIPWHAPKNPDMVIEAAAMTPPHILADQVIERLTTPTQAQLKTVVR